MTDQSTAQPVASRTVPVDPMAAVSLLSAEREFYRNRCLLLENEVLVLRRQIEAQANDKTTEPKVMNNDHS
ncbi:hypothetical protein [Mesorhizobium sp. 8]|uniref:hypothetical protein n=1 Tax=Mesorhizobium sp. 8 TaxID=2584466 RepID=UPI00111F7972|nr:hypothetical protein [Mesorhizobium sp. 8]QDC00341.1 hypothetical protein FGU64_07890 [Mesorhizobium sp. 8]